MPAVSKDYIVAPGCKVYRSAIKIKSGGIGMLRSLPTPKTESVYGPRLMPSLVISRLTHSLLLRHECLASVTIQVADIRQDAANSTPHVFHHTDCTLSIMGRGGALVETLTFNRRV